MGRIYRFIGEDNIIKYVGKVDGDSIEDVRRRISEHKVADPWSDNEAFRVEISDYVAKSPLETFALETHFINKYGTGRFYNYNYQVGMGCISFITEKIDECTWQELKPYKCVKLDDSLPSYLQGPFDKRKKNLLRNMFIYHYNMYKCLIINPKTGRTHSDHEKALESMLKVISKHFPSLLDETDTQFGRAYAEWKGGIYAVQK